MLLVDLTTEITTRNWICNNCMRFEVLTAVKMPVFIFWAVTYCLHFEGLPMSTWYYVLEDQHLNIHIQPWPVEKLISFLKPKWVSYHIAEIEWQKYCGIINLLSPSSIMSLWISEQVWISTDFFVMFWATLSSQNFKTGTGLALWNVGSLSRGLNITQIKLKEPI